jgi:hypothetical protein
MDSDVFKDDMRVRYEILDKSKVSYHLIPLKQGELSRWVRTSKKISSRIFINTLNHLHFISEEAYVVAVSRTTEENFLIRIFPGPCIENKVTCKLPVKDFQDLHDLMIKHLIVDDGKSIFVMQIEVKDISPQSLTLVLNKEGSKFSDRQAKRFQCFLVDAKISQRSAEIIGRLQDFTPLGLRINLYDVSDAISRTINPGENIHIELHKLDQQVFSGECRCIRYEDKEKSLIVSPIKSQQVRTKEKKIRNPRLNLVPTPKISFVHPFTNHRVTYEIQDLTTAGFSVQENKERGLLIPGLIISNIHILFAGGYKMSCSAQVVYARNQKKNNVKYGFAIKDMDVVTYNQLFDIYTSAHDIHANVSREVDMNALWEFFFESGFIYPKKYVSLSCFKEEFKQTYEKLYHDSPEIFANFTYQHNGIIYGHVSIIKAYERTWMIHHLAAKPMGRKRVGLYVLNHILNYFDGLYRMPSIGMEHMIFYYRPENKFPDYFFGGFCRDLKNPKGCSIDCFAYLNCVLPRNNPLPSGWTVHECAEADFERLEAGYESASGGLMIDALCLDKKSGSQSIQNLYGKYGLKRRTTSYVLDYKKQSKAYLIFDESDMGINLSELLNSIKVIVIDDKGLSWPIVQTALGNISISYPKEKVPVLVYPYTFMGNQGVGYETRYNLWVLNSRFGDKYTESLKDKAKIRISKLLLKYLLSRILNK